MIYLFKKRASSYLNIICTLYWKVILSIWYWQSNFPRSFHNLFVVLMSSAHVIITPDLLHPPDMILLRGITNTGSTYPEETWKNKACYFFGVTVSYWLTDWEQTNNDGHKVFVNPPQPKTLNSIISVSKILICTVQTTNSNLILIPNCSWTSTSKVLWAAQLKFDFDAGKHCCQPQSPWNWLGLWTGFELG